MTLENVTPIVKEDMLAIMARISATVKEQGRTLEEQKAIVLSNYLRAKGIPVDGTLTPEKEWPHDRPR